MQRTLSLSGALITAFTASASAAAIAYTDATVAGMSGTANTIATSGTVSSGTADAATLFRIRGLNGGSAAQGGADTVNFSNNGSAIQNIANPPSATPPTLRTTLGGLDPGTTYEIFVFFWDDVSTGAATSTPTAASAWDLAAKLSTDSTYTSFSSTSGYFVTRNNGTVDANNYSPAGAGFTPILMSDITGMNVLGQAADTYVDGIDNNRAMFGGLLSSTFTGSATLRVDIQPTGLTAGRTWYDGIGVRPLPIPEPGSVALLMLGALSLIKRRR